MKAEELMIGDWVKYKGMITQIKSFNAMITEFCVYLEPIQLTHHILRRLGFEKRHNYWQLDEGWVITILTTNNITPLSKLVITNYFKTEQADYDSGWQDVIYLHELQHAMKLCRIDKKFEL